MKVPYYENPGGNLTVHVELQHVSDVYLVDEFNFREQQAGREFKYFGGNYSQSPVQITVNGRGKWFLIVDNGSGEQFSYKWIK